MDWTEKQPKAAPATLVSYMSAGHAVMLDAVTAMEMIAKEQATRLSVMERLGRTDLIFQVTGPVTLAVRHLQGAGFLYEGLSDVIKPMPSLARGDYPFEFAEGAKAAFLTYFGVGVNQTEVEKVKKFSAVFDVLPLEGWVGTEETADILGVTKQYVHYLIKTGRFKSTRRIGDGKPVYIISQLEVMGFKADRDAKAAAKAK